MHNIFVRCERLQYFVNDVLGNLSGVLNFKMESIIHFFCLDFFYFLRIFLSFFLNGFLNHWITTVSIKLIIISSFVAKSFSIFSMIFLEICSGFLNLKLKISFIFFVSIFIDFSALFSALC